MAMNSSAGIPADAAKSALVSETAAPIDSPSTGTAADR
jgi:hypothetical protein